MNYSTVVFLINDRVRAISTAYEDGDGAKRVTFKTLDATIKVDDLVIVPSSTRHKFTVVKVKAVDVEVDFDSGVQMDWVVGRVGRAAYEDTLAMEATAVQAIRAAEQNKKRNELRDALLANAGELKALPIAGAGGGE